MLRKAALQLHIDAQSEDSRNKGFREFEADLSALLSHTENDMMLRSKDA